MHSNPDERFDRLLSAMASGEPIMRLPNPIGFGRNEEW
jgi:hypothetical protein